MSEPDGGFTATTDPGQAGRMPPHPDRIGILAPMPSELRPVTKVLALTRSTLTEHRLHAGRLGDVEIVATRTGIGTAAATRATERLLQTASVDHVLVVGIAGGVHPDADIASIVVPNVVIDSASGARTSRRSLGGREGSGTLLTGDGLVVDLDDFGALAAADRGARHGDGRGRRGVRGARLRVVGGACAERPAR